MEHTATNCIYENTCKNANWTKQFVIFKNRNTSDFILFFYEIYYLQFYKWHIFWEKFPLNFSFSMIIIMEYTIETVNNVNRLPHNRKIMFFNIFFLLRLVSWIVNQGFDHSHSMAFVVIIIHTVKKVTVFVNKCAHFAFSSFT